MKIDDFFHTPTCGRERIIELSRQKAIHEKRIVCCPHCQQGFEPILNENFQGVTKEFICGNYVEKIKWRTLCPCCNEKVEVRKDNFLFAPKYHPLETKK